MKLSRKTWRSGVLAVLVLLSIARSALAQQASAAAPQQEDARADSVQSPTESIAVPIDIARFRDRAEATLAAAGADKGYWGVLVTDADTGEVLYALNSARYFAPASNVKLFTTAMAMATLGPDFRIRTTIETSGTVDYPGRLQGDLVLVGRGKPQNLSNQQSLTFSKELSDLARSEKALPI